MADFLDFVSYRRSIPHKAVITMDDGYSSAYEIAFPILKKHGCDSAFRIHGLRQDIEKRCHLGPAENDEGGGL
jgi:hypothetical protein